MGMGAGNSGTSRRGRRSGPIAEINVTPMVDVMLVLLIIFMVAAPLMTVGVPIDLPQTRAKALDTDNKPITVTVTPTGELFIGEAAVTLDTLVAAVVAAAPEQGTDQRIYLRGDATANYGAVMQVMGALSGAGYARIGLITEQAP